LNSNMATERQLLLSLLAFQNGFISQAQLQAAFGAWIADRSRELSTYLVQHDALQKEDLAFLDRMVDFHLMKFDGDPSQSLAELSGCSAIAAELRLLAGEDAFVLRTLSHLPIRSGSGGQNHAVDSRTMQPFGTIQQYPRSVTEMGLARNASELDGISLDPSSSLPTGAPSTKTNSERFHIVKEHARGGLGVLYVAEDQELRREVALKQIRKDRADFADYRAKFVREAEVTGQLEHPGIVPVYALGTDESGRPYYAMRFIRGEDLQTRLRAFHVDRKAKKLPLDGSELRGLLRRFIDVCNAVDYAHDRGVLHRDLKPGNVMLGKHGETLVVDWGLAKTLGVRPESDPSCENAIQSELPISKEESQLGTETQYGAFLGTPAYAPPEQMLGQLDRLGPASDVYSLGAILYELLTGQVAIRGSTLEEVITKSTRGDYAAPRLLEPTVPKPLDAVCRKAMAIQPQDRYATAFDLRQEIERWLDDASVMAYREPLSVRTTRWMRNHPAASAAVAASLLFGILAAAAFIAISTQHSRQLAHKNQEVTFESRKALEALAGLNVQLARSGYERDRISFALKHLYSIPPVQRRFDWYLLRKLLDDSSLTIAGNGFIDFSPDGQQFAIDFEGEVRLASTFDGQELHPLNDLDLNGVIDVRFSSDNQRLALALGHKIKIIATKNC
jgi:eukaryotic-like serine/threonine-protein kinase